MAQDAAAVSTTEPLSQETIDEFVGNAHGNLARVRELLSLYPDLLQARARWDEDALGAAAHAGSRPVAEYLLGQGAPLDLPTAAMLGRLEDVESFLGQDPAAAHGAGAHGLSILYHAAAGGSIPVAARLISQGVDVNSGAGANAALHAAAGKGNLEMAGWLLDQGADPAALDYEDKTPLNVAEDNNQKDMVELLRQASAG